MRSLQVLIIVCATAVSACGVDEDCSLNGVCSSGSCVCSPGWRGSDCGLLNLAPAVWGMGYNRTGESLPTSSWGANIVRDGNNTWHMLAAEFENHCDIASWSPNSRIVHAISRAGALGPYKLQGEAVPAFAHNPKVVRAPDGTWLMYTIGTPRAETPPLHNCTAPAGERKVLRQQPGRTPGNHESNVTLYTSESLAGPWSRFGIVLGSNSQGDWDEDTSNPSPWVLPNGTVLLMYRGCVVAGGGCKDEYIGVAAAQHWRGPYTRLLHGPSRTTGSVLPNVPAEDPSLWVDTHGHFHFLMHYIPDTRLVARHAFARSFTGPWTVSDTVPYNSTVVFAAGSPYASVTYEKRERPHIVFDEAGIPKYFVTGVVEGSKFVGYSGLSSTLVQSILP